MPSAGAADGDSQIAFTLMDELRQEIQQQVCHPAQELPGGRKFIHKALHLAVAAGLFLELRHVVGIGKKTNVEHQVSLGGQPEAVAEGDERDRHDLARFAAAEASVDHLAKLIAVYTSGINDLIRQLTHRL